MEYKIISVRITNEERKKLKIVAAHNDMSMSDFTRTLIQSFLSTQTARILDREEQEISEEI